MRRTGQEESQDRRPTPWCFCPGLFWCMKLCCHARGLRPSCGTLWKRTPASRLYASRGSGSEHDNPCCYMTAQFLASVPFLSGGPTACPPSEKVGERIGKEWVIDRSLFEKSLIYLIIFIILRWIIQRRVFQHWIFRQRFFQRR